MTATHIERVAQALASEYANAILECRIVSYTDLARAAIKASEAYFDEIREAALKTMAQEIEQIMSELENRPHLPNPWDEWGNTQDRL